MDGKPEQWSDDGGEYLVNHTVQVELKADQGIYYVSQDARKKTFSLTLNQTFPEKKIVKESLSLDPKGTEDYKFTYDAKHDEVIFAIYNPKTKNLDVEFYDGTTLQDQESPRKDTIRLSGTDEEETGYIQGILPVDSTHFILHLYQRNADATQNKNLLYRYDSEA